MRIAPVLASLAAALPLALAAASWKEVKVSSTYTTRSDNAFSVCGDKLCLLGGRDACSGKACVSKVANVFDTASSKWSEFPAVPAAGGVHHFQPAPDPSDVEGDCVWVGGAYKNGYPREDTVDNIYSFCAGSGKWTKGAKIARPRGAGGAFSYDGKYYLVSGNVGGHGAHAKVVPWFDAYDPSTGSWSKLADQPNPRDHFVAAVLKDKLYVAGGRATDVEEFFNAVEDKIDVYDFKTAKWSTLSEKYPGPAGGTLTALLGDRIVYGGGEGFGKATDKVFYFDGDKFTSAPSLLTARHGTGFASCGGALWVAGGVSDQGGEPEVGSTQVLVDGDVPVCKASAAGASAPKDTASSSSGDSDSSSGSSTSNASSKPKCFPASATVELETGEHVAMSNLRLGDRVRVSAASFSPVYFFSHKSENTFSHFVRISTGKTSTPLSLTGGHLLMVNGKLAPARHVVVGDILTLSSPLHTDRSAAVTAVDSHLSRGLYNPHTVAGDIVVNGVLTSCMTDALPRNVALSLLQPVEAIFSIAGASAVGHVNDLVLSAIERFNAASAVRAAATAFGVKSEL